MLDLFIEVGIWITSSSVAFFCSVSKKERKEGGRKERRMEGRKEGRKRENIADYGMRTVLWYL